MQTQQTDFEQLYKQLQKEHSSLKRDLYNADKKVENRDKQIAKLNLDAARYRSNVALFQSFKELMSEVFKKASKFLTSGEKLIFYALSEQILYSENERQGIYTRVLAGDIAYRTGRASRTLGPIKRLIRMGLIMQMSGEYIDDELWLAIPDDILYRLENISDEFERKWHAPMYCDECKIQVAPRVTNTQFIQCRCPHCKKLLKQGAIELTSYMDEEAEYRELDDVESSYLQHAVLEIQRERQTLQDDQTSTDMQPVDEEQSLTEQPLPLVQTPSSCPWCGGTDFHKSDGTWYCKNVMCGFSIEQE